MLFFKVEINLNGNCIFCDEFLSYDYSYLNEIRESYLKLSKALDFSDFDYIGSNFKISDILQYTEGGNYDV